MPVEELQLALQGCPECADLAQVVLENKSEIISAVGGAAGTLALLIQTSNDLHDLVTKLRGDSGSADTVTVEIERDVEQDEICKSLEISEDMDDDEIHKRLEQHVQDLMDAYDVGEFRCQCMKCDSEQSSLKDF